LVEQRELRSLETTSVKDRRIEERERNVAPQRAISVFGLSADTT
jgi:hypothetical protein